MQKLVVGIEGLHWNVRPFRVSCSYPFSFLLSQLQKLFSMFVPQHFINPLKRMTEGVNQTFQLSSGLITFCHDTCKIINPRPVKKALGRVFCFVF